MKFKISLENCRSVKSWVFEKNAHFWAMHHENQCGEPLYAGRGFIVFKVRRGKREERWYNVKWTSTIPRFYSIHSGQKIQDLTPQKCQKLFLSWANLHQKISDLNPFSFETHLDLQFLEFESLRRSLHKSLEINPFGNLFGNPFGNPLGNFFGNPFGFESFWIWIPLIWIPLIWIP